MRAVKKLQSIVSVHSQPVSGLDLRHSSAAENALTWKSGPELETSCRKQFCGWPYAWVPGGPPPPAPIRTFGGPLHAGPSCVRARAPELICSKLLSVVGLEEERRSGGSWVARGGPVVGVWCLRAVVLHRTWWNRGEASRAACYLRVCVTSSFLILDRIKNIFSK